MTDFSTGIPNIRVVIREASSENLITQVPNITVRLVEDSQYNVNLIPTTIATLRTGSFNTYADAAGFAYTASIAQYALNLSGSIESASYAYTASVALNAITASYVANAASTWNTITNKPTGLVSSSVQIIDYNIFATTGSNTFTGNQTFLGNFLVSGSQEAVFSSSVPLVVHEDIQARGQVGEVHLMVDEVDPHIEIYVPNESTFYENAELGTYQLFLYNTASGYIGFALDMQRAGYSGWTGPGIGGDNGQLVYPTFIGFQDASNYTDGRVTFLTPLSASAGMTGSLFGTASWARNALTASYAVNAGAGAGFPFSGSAVITGSLLVSGSGITGSLLGTSSWANNAISSSFATTASAATSITFTPTTASFSISSSRSVTSSFAITSSYAANADLFDGLNSTIFATTGSNTFVGSQTITGSLITNADTLVFTGSILTTGSMSVTGSINVLGSITGSLFGSSSFATTASAATSITFTPTTASYALTSSYIDGGLY